MSQAANTNSNQGRVSKSITYRDVNRSQHAHVVPGKRVVLWGIRQVCGYNKAAHCSTLAIKPYRVEFKIGDSAVYGSYNLVYTGTVVAIGPKTITVEEYPGTQNARRHRMSIERFNGRNADYDAEAIFKRNSEWLD